MRILFAGALLCSLSLAGCDALDTKEDLNLTDEMMATRRYQMFDWGYRVYEHIPYGFTAIDGNLFAAVSDEAQYVTTFSSTQRFNEGSWSAYYNPDDCYTSYYNGIYAAHDYLDKSVDYRYILGMHRDTLTSNGLDSYRRDIVDVQRLRDAIADTPDGASFRLREDERCPMLNDSGLCDIITACGEGALCQICADHPRYRNEFSTFTEVGFGLCCEAAADLTLHWPQPMTWHTQGGKRPQGSPEEEALLQARAALIRIMQDRTRGIPARLNALCEAAGTVMPTRTAAEWADFLRTLERLDPTWDAVLTRLTNVPDDLPDFSPLAVEQFTVYLLHRHVPGALLDGDLPGRVLFCAVSGMLFLRLSTLLGENEAARMYSSEIEYSEENLCSFLDELDAAEDE